MGGWRRNRARTGWIRGTRGFWILAKTGSTALMGGLMAASLLPRILVSPVAGCANAILNVFIGAVMQITVPRAMRGNVFSLMGMVTMGLTPVAFAFVVSLPRMFLPSFRWNGLRIDAFRGADP